MTRDKLLEKLGAEFPLKVCTLYHVQITTENGPHNIWFSKGQIKFQPCGQKDWDYVTADVLLKKLRSYDYGKTDLAFMQSLTKFIKEVAGKKGVFTDAGWKNGKAKYALIRSQENGDMDIVVRTIDIESPQRAEAVAIIHAIDKWPGETIYTDCKNEADKYNDSVQWIPRKQNKQADSIGNMRGATV